MKIRIVLIIVFSGAFTLSAFADTSRDVLIQKELDCVDQHKNAGLTWSDLCYVPPEPSSTEPQDSQVINDQLNQAEGSIVSQKAASFFHDRVNTFDVNFQSTYNRYHRPLYQAEYPPNDFNNSRTLDGVWYGGEGKYTFRPPTGSFLNTSVLNYYAVEGIYAKGTNDASQKVQSALAVPNYFEKLNTKDIPGYMYEARVLLGKDFMTLPYLRVTPYSGFGIRDSSDKGGGHLDSISDGTLALGYNVSDFYYYVPVGLTFDLAATQDYEVSWNLEYDYLVKGSEKDYYSNFDAFSNSATFFQNYGFNFTNQNVKYTLNHGWGARTSLKFLKHFSLVDVYIEPYIRYWYIGASKIATGNVGYNFVTNDQTYTSAVNKNFTLEVGSSLGVEF